MKLVSQEISDLKMEFEGGASLSVDWFAILRRAANNVLDSISPETLKKRAELYGGTARDLYIFYCPADLEIPSDIYENNGRFGNQITSSRKYSYTPPAAFYAKQEYDKYTVEYINGVRFLIIRHTDSPASLTVAEMEAVAGHTSDQTLSLNKSNFIYGIAALKRTFSEESGTAFTADATTDFLTSAGHGLNNGDRVFVFTDTALPAGLSAGVVYFVVNKTANTFQLSLTSGGAAINLTNNGTGIHKWHAAAQNEISATITAIDITDYLEGVVIIPSVFQNAANINRVELVLEQDTASYYTVKSTADSIGDNFIDGMNIIRFSMANAVITGSPNPAAIVKWRIRIIADDGTSQTVIIDKLTIQKTTFKLIEYYSNKMFVDGTSGAWKDTPIAGDSINLNRDAADILHYEAVILIAQTSSFVKIAEQEFRNFTDQLKRKYSAYWEKHPSSEVPLSYSHARNLPNDGIKGFEKEQLDVEVQPYP